MTLEIIQITSSEWEDKYAASAHRAVFEEILPPGLERIDYALLVVNASLGALGYATVRELDAESAYLKRGGAFATATDSTRAVTSYRLLVSHLAARYRRITTLVENRNVRYLKLALSIGFYPIGIRNFRGGIFVELLRGEE